MASLLNGGKGVEGTERTEGAKRKAGENVVHGGGLGGNGIEQLGGGGAGMEKDGEDFGGGGGNGRQCRGREVHMGGVTGGWTNYMCGEGR